MKFVENRCFITLWTDLTDHFGLAGNKPDVNWSDRSFWPGRQ